MDVIIRSGTPSFRRRCSDRGPRSSSPRTATGPYAPPLATAMAGTRLVVSYSRRDSIQPSACRRLRPSRGHANSATGWMTSVPRSGATRPRSSVRCWRCAPIPIHFRRSMRSTSTSAGTKLSASASSCSTGRRSSIRTDNGPRSRQSSRRASSRSPRRGSPDSELTANGRRQGVSPYERWPRGWPDHVQSARARMCRS